MSREFGPGEELVFEDTHGMPIGSMGKKLEEDTDSADPDAPIGRSKCTRRYLRTVLGLDV